MFRNTLKKRREADRTPNVNIKYQIFVRTIYSQAKDLILLIKIMTTFIMIICLFSTPSVA